MVGGTSSLFSAVLVAALLLLAAAGHSATAQFCDEQRECLDTDVELDNDAVANLTACVDFCMNFNGSCNYYSYKDQHGTNCRLYESCTLGDDCDKCNTSAITCDVGGGGGGGGGGEGSCDQALACDGGTTIGIEFGQSEVTCKQLCEDEAGQCTHFTIYDSGACILYSECEFGDSPESCEDCVTVDLECLKQQQDLCDDGEGNNEASKECGSGSIQIDLSFDTILNDCQQLCRNNDDCSYYTHYTDSNLCVLFSECELEDDTCDNGCTTGSVIACGSNPSDGDCEEANGFECGTGSEIVDLKMGTASVTACRASCNDNDHCEFFTHYPDDSYCLLYSSCMTLECESGTNCTTGAKNCTGFPPAGEVCEVPKECQTGQLMDFQMNIKASEDCNAACALNAECMFYTWYDTEMCALYETCELQAEECTDGCMTGAKECDDFPHAGSGNSSTTEPPSTGNSTSSGSRILVVGGGTLGSRISSSSAAVYDLSVESVCDTSDYPGGDGVLGAASANLGDGRVAICGGIAYVDSHRAIRSDCHAHGSASSGWAGLPALSELRAFPGSAFVSGRGLWWVMGGHDDEKVHFTTEAYETSTSTWTDGPELPSSKPRYGFCAAHFDNRNGVERTFIAGGADASDNIIDSVNLFDWNTGLWAEVTGLEIPTAYPACAVWKGTHVVMAGGFTVDGPTDAVKLYDLTTNIFSDGPSLPTAASGPSAVTAGDGGDVFVILDAGQVYKFGGSSWELVFDGHDDGEEEEEGEEVDRAHAVAVAADEKALSGCHQA